MPLKSYASVQFGQSRPFLPNILSTIFTTFPLPFPPTSPLFPSTPSCDSPLEQEVELRVRLGVLSWGCAWALPLPWIFGSSVYIDDAIFILVACNQLRARRKLVFKPLPFDMGSELGLPYVVLGLLRALFLEKLGVFARISGFKLF